MAQKPRSCRGSPTDAFSPSSPAVLRQERHPSDKQSGRHHGPRRLCRGSAPIQARPTQRSQVSTRIAHRISIGCRRVKSPSNSAREVESPAEAARQLPVDCVARRLRNWVRGGAPTESAQEVECDLAQRAVEREEYADRRRPVEPSCESAFAKAAESFCGIDLPCHLERPNGRRPVRRSPVQARGSKWWICEQSVYPSSPASPNISVRRARLCEREEGTAAHRPDQAVVWPMV